jgi:hypothetical protein
VNSKTLEGWKKAGEGYLWLSAALCIISAIVIFWLCGGTKPMASGRMWNPFPIGISTPKITALNIQYVDSAMQAAINYLEKEHLTEGPVWSPMPSWGNLDSHYHKIKKFAQDVHFVAAILPDSGVINQQSAETIKTVKSMLSDASNINGNYLFKHRIFNRYPGWLWTFSLSLFGTIFGIIKLSKGR